VAKRQWLVALDESREWIATLPPADAGRFYLNARGKPVCPNPNSPGFATLTRHFGSVKGAWPRIVDS
jgi:hypothetical protein